MNNKAMILFVFGILFICQPAYPQNQLSDGDPNSALVILEMQITGGPPDLPITQESIIYPANNLGDNNSHLRSAFGLTIGKVAVSGPRNIPISAEVKSGNISTVNAEGNGVSGEVVSEAEVNVSGKAPAEEDCGNHNLAIDTKTETNPTIAIVDYSGPGISIREIDAKGNFKIQASQTGKRGTVQGTGANNYQGGLKTDLPKGYNVESSNAVKQNVTATDPGSVNTSGSLQVKETANVIGGQPTTYNKHTEHHINVQTSR